MGDQNHDPRDYIFSAEQETISRQANQPSPTSLQVSAPILAGSTADAAEIRDLSIYRTPPQTTSTIARERNILASASLLSDRAFRDPLSEIENADEEFQQSQALRLSMSAPEQSANNMFERDPQTDQHQFVDPQLLNNLRGQWATLDQAMHVHNVLMQQHQSGAQQHVSGQAPPTDRAAIRPTPPSSATNGATSAAGTLYAAQRDEARRLMALHAQQRRSPQQLQQHLVELLSQAGSQQQALDQSHDGQSPQFSLHQRQTASNVGSPLYPARPYGMLNNPDAGRNMATPLGGQIDQNRATRFGFPWPYSDITTYSESARRHASRASTHVQSRATPTGSFGNDPNPHANSGPAPVFGSAGTASFGSAHSAPQRVSSNADLATAIVQALTNGYPTYGNTGTRAETEAKYARIADDLNAEITGHVSTQPVARVLTFDGSPGLGTASVNTHEGMTATHQMSTRHAPLFMTNTQITEWEKNNAVTFPNALRESNAKQAQMSATAATVPASLRNIDASTGPTDEQVNDVLKSIDASFDWLAVLSAAVGGKLVVKIDSDLSIEGRQACVRYMCVNNDMLRSRFNPFSRHMNTYIQSHRDTLVYVPASILVAQDRRIGHKLLQGLNDRTRQATEGKAKATAGKSSQTRTGNRPYLAVPDILLALLRLGYKPDIDTPRKNELITTFITRPREYKTVDELATLFEETEEEFMSLNSNGRTYHDGVFTEQLATWILWLRDRTWAEEWIEHMQLNSKWPHTFEQLVTMTREKAAFETETVERARYRQLYPSRHSAVHAIGMQDARKLMADKSARNIRPGPDRSKKRPGSYTQTPYDRRSTISRGTDPRELQNREKNTKHTQIRALNRSNKYALGDVSYAKDAACPYCHLDRCRGRCWCCLKPGTCAEPPHGHMARDCKFRDVGINDVKNWDPEWIRSDSNTPCRKCGNMGHPPHACDEKLKRRVLIRLAKDANSGQWVNHIVAVCTLKPGHEAALEDMDVRPEDFEIELTGQSKYTGCDDSCGPDGCGQPHVVDVAHIYKPHQRLPVRQVSSTEYDTYVLKARDVDEPDEDDDMTEDESHHSSLLPIFAATESADIDDGTCSDSNLVGSTMTEREDGRLLWDTGAMRSTASSAAGARGYIRDAKAKLHGAGGAPIKTEGEGDFQSLIQSGSGRPHTLMREASICLGAPSIVSAGEKFAEGYGAVHNLDGMFIPRDSPAFDKVSRTTGRHDKILHFRSKEHWVITPEKEKLRLHHELRKNLYYLVPIQPTTTAESEHLKDARTDARYGTGAIGMINTQQNITHDCTLATYVRDMQKVIQDYEALSRRVAHFGAHNRSLDELLVATTSCLHELEQCMSNPATQHNHDNVVRAQVAKIEQAGLKRVCTRCMTQDCPSLFDDTVTCTNACVSCQSVTHEHVAGHDCGALHKRDQSTMVVTDHALGTLATGAPDDDPDGSEMVREHAELHASCDVTPCRACSAAANSSAGTQTSPQPVPIAQPVATKVSPYVKTNDIVSAFQSLHVSESTRLHHSTDEPDSVSHSINAAGVCTRCRKHRTSCACQPVKISTHGICTGCTKHYTACQCHTAETKQDRQTRVNKQRQDVATARSTQATVRSCAHIRHASPAGKHVQHSQSDSGNAGSTSQVGVDIIHHRSSSGVAGPSRLCSDNVRHIHHGSDSVTPGQGSGSAGPTDHGTGYAEPTREDSGNAGSDTGTAGYAGSHTITRKRKDDLTEQEMLQFVQANAWMHVLDASMDMPTVLNMPPRVWLSILPQREQAIMAVHHQNAVHATMVWENATSTMGIESEQAMRAERVLRTIEQQRAEHAEHAQRVAEVMLSTGASE